MHVEVFAEDVLVEGWIVDVDVGCLRQRRLRDPIGTQDAVGAGFKGGWPQRRMKARMCRPRLVDEDLDVARVRGIDDSLEVVAQAVVGAGGQDQQFSVRMLGDRVLAEEVTQDVFVRVWDKLPGFRGDSAFGTWLHRLAVNVVLSHRKTVGIAAARQSRDDAAIDTASARPVAVSG